MTSHPIPDAALEGHLAVLGTSGYGKSNAIKGAVERMLARGERVVIVDPTGVWWGLRLTRDGKRPSPYPLVIFGGRHADLPLDAGSGERVAQVLGTSTTPAILDTQQMSVAARTRFFTDFAEAILRENRGPMHLILDEAHLFAPQSGGHGLVPALLHATNNLVALGRSAGLRIVLITQRAAKLHKDALSQATGLVVMGLIDPRDQKAAKGWLNGAPDQSMSKEIMASLAGLPIGTGWVYAPRIGVLEKATFPLVSTFDSGRPEANADAPALKPLDVAALRAALLTPVNAAGPVAKVARQPNPKTELIRQPDAERSPSATEVAAAEQRGFVRGEEQGLRRGVAAGWKAAATLFERDVLVRANEFPPTPDHEDAEEAIADAPGLKTWPKSNGSAPAAPPNLKKRPQIIPGIIPEEVKPLKRIVVSAPKTQASEGLNSASHKMLAVLDKNPPVRRSWQQVATLAGLKARGGHFNAGKKALIDGGLVKVDGGLVSIAKPSGDAKPEHLDPAALVDTWSAALSGAAPKLLRTLFAFKRPVTRTAVAEDLGIQPRGGHWNAGWKELRDNGLVVVEGDTARLSELFRA